MNDLVTGIAALVALLLFGLALVIVFDRARHGYARAEAQQRARRQSEHELNMRLEQVERAVAEQKPAILAARRQLQAIEEECAELKRSLDRTELPFSYTVVPMESRDMYARSWKFMARHPGLGVDQPEIEPAGQWEQGRMYAVAAENQTEARSVMDRLLPRHRGFVVVGSGEGATEPSAASK
ncbi:MAG: hypothetical protein VW600_18300 [Ferrovibrio sp.]